MKHSVFLISLLAAITLTACRVEIRFITESNESDTAPQISTEENQTENENSNQEEENYEDMQQFISESTGLTMQYPKDWLLTDKETLITFSPNQDSPFYVNIFIEKNGNPDNLPIESYINDNVEPKYENTVEFSDKNIEYFSIDQRAALRIKNIKTSNEAFEKVYIVDSTTIINITYSAKSVNENDYILATKIIESIKFPTIDSVNKEEQTQSQVFDDQGFVILYPSTWIKVETKEENTLLKLYFTSSSEQRNSENKVEPETAVIKIIKHTNQTENELFEIIKKSLKDISSNEIQIFDLKGTEIIGTSWQQQYIVLLSMPDNSTIEINTTYSSEDLLTEIKKIVNSFHLKL